MTLLSEIQTVIEKTYRPSGINLEDCLIGASRSRQLAARSSLNGEDLSGEAHTFLRMDDGNLYIAIFYSRDLIQQLEKQDPREMISHRNIDALISFVEEITHGIHAALAFRSGQYDIDTERFACEMETQAKVDTYWMVVRYCRLLVGQAVDGDTRGWIKHCIFERETFGYENPLVAKRYQTANRIAHDFIQGCELLPKTERLGAIRDFRDMSLFGKARLARALRN